jgi:Putative peptidoglycan binding domain/Trypsin
MHLLAMVVALAGQAVAAPLPPLTRSSNRASLPEFARHLARDVQPLLQRIAVFGEDDRGPVPAELNDARDKIGLLYNGKAQIVCTAFCVAPDVIATAAHCLYRTADDRPPALADFVFARSRNQTEGASRIAGFASKSISQNIISGNMQIRVRPPIDAASDWALIRLAMPGCKSSLAIKAMTNEEIAQAALANQVFQLSYHRDYTNWEMAYSKPCEAAQWFGDVSPGMIARDFTNPLSLILHRCDTGGASSGSPLLVAGPGGPFVIGINVGTYVLSRTLMRDSGSAQRLRQDVIANTAVNAAAFQPLIAALREANILQGPAAIRRLQQLLGDLHHYAGPVDGAYGTLLRSAIQDFELTQGLPVTGLASHELLTLLEKASVAARQPAHLPSSAAPLPATSSGRDLSQSSPRNAPVRR